MRIGDIFVVQERPCPGNDITIIAQDVDYPVYGIVIDTVEDDQQFPSEVYTQTGKRLTREWYFQTDEVQIIEAPL